MKILNLVKKCTVLASTLLSTFGLHASEKEMTLANTIQRIDEIKSFNDAHMIRLYADGEYGWEMEDASLERRLFVTQLAIDYLTQNKVDIIKAEGADNYQAEYLDAYDTKLTLLTNIAVEKETPKDYTNLIDASKSLLKYVEENAPDKLIENIYYVELIGKVYATLEQKDKGFEYVAEKYRTIPFIEESGFYSAHEDEFTAWLTAREQSAPLSAEQQVVRDAFFTEQKQKYITNPEKKSATQADYQQIARDLWGQDGARAQLTNISHIKGDVYIDGNFSPTKDELKAIFGENVADPFLIDGNLVVNGTLHDDGAYMSFYVTGTVVAQSIFHENSNFFIGGDVIANALIYGNYNDGKLLANGGIQAPVIYSDDHSMPITGHAFYSVHLNPNGAAIGFVNKPLGKLTVPHPLLFQNYDKTLAQALKGEPIIKPQYQLSTVKTLPKTEDR